MYSVSVNSLKLKQQSTDTLSHFEHFAPIPTQPVFYSLMLRAPGRKEHIPILLSLV